jgi:predicted NUDIX family NTP pyrophosphohydrolase
MPVRSAGIILFRRAGGQIEVLLVHPGGPFWARKDENAWSIPKGEVEDTEDPLAAASRELQEETGATFSGVAIPLRPLKQPGGKVIHAWAAAGDFDPAHLRSNTFSLEWPPRSGRTAQFPEVDRAAWFQPDEARLKLVKGQKPLIDQLLEAVRPA